MKTFQTLALLLLFAAVPACHQANNEDMNFEMAEDRMEAPSPKSAPEQPQTERKLIKNGRVEFESENMAKTRESVMAAAAKHQAYISSEQAYKYDDRNSVTLVVRVPASAFDLFLADATSGVHHFEVKEVNVTDVTEEFLDIEARLSTKKELEARYLELLKQATTVTEMLEIERQIGELRAEIESIEGRLKYLTNQVSLSTLTLTFYEKVPNHNAFTKRLKEGLGAGWENLLSFMVFTSRIWPFVLIILVLGYIRRRRRSRKRN